MFLLERVYKTYEKIEVAHVKEKRQTQDDFLKLEVTVRPKHFTAFPKIFQPMGLIGPIGPISSIPSRPNIPPTSRPATQSTLRPSLGKVKPFLGKVSNLFEFSKISNY